MKNLPFSLRVAASRFSPHRADYYFYLSSVLKSSNGNIKVLQIFDNDSMRYQGAPRGVLSDYFYDTYANNGGDLATTFEGIFPDDEVANIRVGQDAGENGIIGALEDVSRLAKLAIKVRNESLGTVAAGLIGIAIAVVMLTAFPIFAVNTIQNAYSFLPVEAWGRVGKNLYSYANGVKIYGIYIGMLLVLIGSYVVWSIDNLTLPIRDWLDEHITLYRVIRDIKGSLFLSTMSTLTRRRGNVMYTLRQSLDAFSASARTPWMKWRIGQIIDGSDLSGSIGTEAFKTGLLSKDMYFFLEDMQRANGFSEGFLATGNHVESTVLPSIIVRMTVYRWVLLGLALVSVLSMFAWTFNVIYEMRDAMKVFLNTN
jgi:hypothetical protein